MDDQARELQKLRVMSYNVQALRPKIWQLSEESKSDVMLVQGTQYRHLEDPERQMWYERRNKYHWVHVSPPRRSTPMSSTATGCSVALCTKFFSKNNIRQVAFHSANLRGRVLVLIVKTRQMHVMLISVYCPCERTPADAVTLQAVLDWIGQVIRQAPARCQVIMAGDLNAKFGQETDAAIGPIWCQTSPEDSTHGAILRQWMLEMRLQCISTWSEMGRWPTHFWNGVGHRIDYFICSHGSRFDGGAVLRKLGYRWQRAKVPWQWDHVPIVGVFYTRLWFADRETRGCISQDKMMRAWVTGEDWLPFQEKVQERLEHKVDILEEHWQTHNANDLFLEVQSAVKEACEASFASPQKERWVSPELKLLNKQLRALRVEAYRVWAKPINIIERMTQEEKRLLFNGLLAWMYWMQNQILTKKYTTSAEANAGDKNEHGHWS